jgi:hypothetical protein
MKVPTTNYLYKAESFLRRWQYTQLGKKLSDFMKTGGKKCSKKHVSGQTNPIHIIPPHLPTIYF